MSDTVVENKPALRGFDRWRAEAYLVGVPPSTASCFQHYLMTAPMPQIWRIGDPHVSTQRCHRAVNERPATADLPRQKRGILIFWRHDDAISLEASEIPGKRERHPWTAASEGRVGNRILLHFRDVGDTRIFDTPDFLRKLARARHQCWLGINAPAIDAIRRAGSTKMR